MELEPTANAGMKRTTDHGEIKRWIERCGGMPAMESSEPRSLLVDLPGVPHQIPLLRLSWAKFFSEFESRALAFEYGSSSTTNNEEYRLLPRLSGAETVQPPAP